MRLRELSRLALAACALLAVACSDDPSDPDPQAEPPVITGVSATTVAPGDTLIIDGANFTVPASGNQVQFTNSLGVSNAFAGDDEQLLVVVDQDATTGAITLTNAGGSVTGPEITVTRGIGDFFVFGGLGPNNVLTLPSPTASTRYLVIPHGTNPNAPFSTEYGYEIQSSNTAVSVSAGSGPTRRAASTRSGIRETFDAWRWEQANELIERVGLPLAPRPSKQVPSEIAPPFRQFYVLNTAVGSASNPANYDRITADLRYTGTKCLVYADIDTLLNPAHNLDQIHFQLLGEAFDNSIEATNVSYFGDYSDIDNNDRVIILISPVVNRMALTFLCDPSPCGFIAGFFLSLDLYSPPQVPAGTTNQGEILYLLASDPAATWGVPQPVDFVADENITTTAHELEHLISFSHRVFNQGGTGQVTWLEEGMAHMAENLNGYHRANEARADDYLQDPGGISLEHGQAPLNQRGGIFLFLRLMADRYGTDILKDIVQSKCTGRACVESVTGRNFYDLFAEFLAATYLSGKGITADPRFNFTSIDLDDYGVVATFPGLIGLSSAGNVFRSSGDLHLYNGTFGLDTNFTFIQSISGVRLRHAIVRVQ